MLKRDDKKKLNQLYDNGTNCLELSKKPQGPSTLIDENRSRTIIQEYVKDPVLYKAHKMDFRIYAFIERASEPMIIKFYDGFGRVSSEKYSLKSNSVSHPSI